MYWSSKLFPQNYFHHAEFIVFTHNCMTWISLCLNLLGIAALDSKASGKMGVRAVVYYMSTTIIAVLIGIIIVVIIHPGKGTKENMHREGKIVQVTAADAFLDLIRYGYDITHFLYQWQQQCLYSHEKDSEEF